MTINEKDRLDLRQEFERIFTNKRLADIAMEAMPPIDYAQLATKRDLDALGAELRGEMSELRGEFSLLESKVDSGFAKIHGRFAQVDGRFAKVDGAIAELRGELRSDIANNLRVMLLAQVSTMVMLGAWVTAVT